MLKIRSKRVGRKHDPSFRIVVVESQRGPKSGDYIEVVGFYNPNTKEQSVKADRVLYWLGQGAQPSDRIHNILISEGVIKGEKRNVLPQKSPVVSEKEEVEEAPAEKSGEESADTPAEVEETEEKTEEAPAEEAPETEAEAESEPEAEVDKPADEEDKSTDEEGEGKEA